LKRWILSVAVWTGIVYFYTFMNVFSFEQYFKQSPITDYIFSSYFHLEIVLTGLILGSLFLLIHRITELPEVRKRSFGFIILLKSLLYFLALTICAFIIYQIFARFEIVSRAEFRYFADTLLNWKFIGAFILYFVVAVFLLNFVIQVNRKFGPGVLFDLIRGKYYHPRQEDLILLFIDLKSSTTIAESLGHERYSQFLRECFHELTPVLLKYNAHVYQYVGDEIVLQWQTEKGLDRLRFVNTYFDFKKRLEDRKNYFLERYGYSPEFKAGCDSGEVTVTEIGDVKREIALHGDVLNTAARLEKKCNEYEEGFLVSENLESQISSSEKYELQFLSNMPLRGKRENVKFFSVSLA